MGAIAYMRRQGLQWVTLSFRLHSTLSFKLSRLTSVEYLAAFEPLWFSPAHIMLLLTYSCMHKNGPIQHLCAR